MSLKTDKLLVSVYANHTCGLAPHCESLGCASQDISHTIIFCLRDLRTYRKP